MVATTAGSVTISATPGLGRRHFRSLLSSLALAIVPMAAVLAVPQATGAATALGSTSYITVPSSNELITTIEDAVLGELYCLVNTILQSPKPTC
jgi:hypothetical protein